MAKDEEKKRVVKVPVKALKKRVAPKGYYYKGNKLIKLMHSDERLDAIENKRMADGHLPGKKITDKNKKLSVTWNGAIYDISTGEILKLEPNEVKRLLEKAWPGREDLKKNGYGVFENPKPKKNDYSK